MAGEAGEFIYESDFDGRGVIHWLATEGGTQPYANPMVTGMVEVTASSLMSDSEPAHAVVGNGVVRCVTQPQPGSWFAIDFKDRRILPTHYTLRHYSSWDTEALRNWYFEASNDGETWTRLRQHTNDQALDGAGATHTWSISTTGAFRYFRVYQWGVNSNNHHYLALSGFELYGTIKAGPLQFPARQTRLFTYRSDFDGQGLVHWLATEDGTQPYVNPAVRGTMDATASSLGSSSEPATAILDNHAVRCLTTATPDQWFEAEFKELRVRPTDYTLRHYSTWDTEALRNWELQGSNDRLNWTTLRTHVNDTALFGAGDTQTWTVPSSPRSPAFRFFRIIQTGLNSNNHHYLALSGFEIYGMVEAETLEFPVPTGPRFHWVSDFDHNGIVYHLATLGRSALYQNPADRGLMNASASSLMGDSEPATAILGNQVVRCVTQAQTGSWFVVDFVEHRVKPTRYSLRHYSNWDTEALRNWRLDGSNDGVNWTLLREHVDDGSLDGIGDTHTWVIPADPDREAFRYFRIHQTGLNSNNHYYLALSGFEVYGTLEGPAVGPRARFLDWAWGRGLVPGVEDSPWADPRGTGQINAWHFAFDGDPTGPVGQVVRQRSEMVDLAGELHCAVTLPVRREAVFAGSPEPGAWVAGIFYRMSGGRGPTTGGDIPVFELSPARDAGLPPLSPGYGYRTFCLGVPVSAEPRGFIRGGVYLVQ